MEASTMRIRVEPEFRHAIKALAAAPRHAPKPE
jgi:hypothetical protein